MPKGVTTTRQVRYALAAGPAGLLEVALQQAFGQSVGVFRINRKPSFFQCLNALLGKPLVRAEAVVGHTIAAAGRNDLGCLRFSLLCQKDG